ncbi:uncharacterized protein [Acropora muricata]|uniref:uncharacterized protein isoform X4 n=1 Tax=Acropora muricata TaxID=159855 RepID=UPI0034E58B1B
MASRVSPKESCVVDIYDNGSSFSVKHIPDGESAIEPFQNENNTREQLLQAIGKVYRPVLSLMKLSGIYFGCTTLATEIQLSGQRRGTLISLCFCCVVVCGVIMIVGAKVSEKIHAVEKIFQTFPVPPEDEGKLLIFMMDLQGEPKGLSVGGLSVITKTLSLTVVGIIVSYGAVMLSLPARF